MDWGFKRHLEVYAGCQRYADEAGWDCSIQPAVDRVLTSKGGVASCDGVLARATPDLAGTARRARVPVVNVWLNSPLQDLPSVFPDFEASGAMAAEHLLARGFRQFGYLGFSRDIDSRLQLAVNMGFDSDARSDRYLIRQSPEIAVPHSDAPARRHGAHEIRSVRAVDADALPRGTLKPQE